MGTMMLDIKTVKLALGLSYEQVIKLVRTGRLRAYRYVGDETVTRADVGPELQGLRFKEADVEEMLEHSLIK